MLQTQAGFSHLGMLSLYKPRLPLQRALKNERRKPSLFKFSVEKAYLCCFTSTTFRKNHTFLRKMVCNFPQAMI